MMRKWLFWLNKEDEGHDSSSASLIDSGACREWTPFLTTLFDGEADEESALQARRHLLVCERCARAWFDWNQTRSLLQNHSAPPPPPSLLWRIRLACRLGQPQPGAQRAPELSAQIFALTSRRAARPSLQQQLNAALHGLRFHTPLAGAVALGAFALLLARDGLIPTSGSLVPPPRVTSRTALSARAQINGETSRAAFNKKATAILTPRVRSSEPTETPLVASVSDDGEREAARERSLSTLARARREREMLGEQSVRLASYSENEPLPMLEAPRPRPIVSSPTKKSEPRRTLAPARLASVDDVTLSPIASSPLPLAPRTATPTVTLASFETSSESPPSSTSRVSRAVRTSVTSRAPLRISAPRALPITMSQPSTAPTSDDSDLDELDSTVQEYRATFADADDSTDYNNDAG